ncbi:MAG: DUF2887 domain-containing protein [Proteobacteria bacterium]|nr:DUF2887 domain-containing protein [Pseudomonadota bacterium]
MKTDSLFYRLFQTEPSLALDLAGLTVKSAGRYLFTSREVKQTAFRFDGILEPHPDQPFDPIVFVEVQFQPDQDFYLRFFGEIILFLRQYRTLRPWLALVIYPYEKVERPSEAARPFLDLSNLRRVYLNQIPLLESANPKLWLIALLTVEDSQLPPIVEKVKAHRNSNPSDGIDWIELLETILVNRLPTITREEIKTMFGLQDSDLKKTRFYQDTFDEGRQEGLEQGFQKGIENGVRKGREEGEAALLLRILERRFGPLPINVKHRIASTDAETLLIYGERVLDAQSLDEIFGD